MNSNILKSDNKTANIKVKKLNFYVVVGSFYFYFV